MLWMPAQVAAQDMVDANKALVVDWLETTYTQTDQWSGYLPWTRWTGVDEHFAAGFEFYEDNDNPALNYNQFISKQFEPVNTLKLESVYLADVALKAEHDLVQASYIVKGSVPDTLLELILNYRILFRIEGGKIAEAWLNHSL